MQKNKVTVNGIDCFYTKYGQGKSIILLHGFAETSTIWQYQIDFLQQFFTVIAPDLPGSGSSMIPETYLDEPFLDDTAWYAEVIKHIIIYENIGPTIIVGHSMGGYIALALAAKNSSLLAGLALVHSTAYPDSDAKKSIRLKGIEMLATYGSEAFIKTTTPNLFGKKFKEDHLEAIEQLAANGRNFSAKALQHYYRAMMQRQSSIELLSTIEFPVQIIAGEEDIAVPLEDSLKQSHLAPTTHFHILEQVGHMGMWENTEKVNKLLYDFFIICFEKIHNK